MPDTTSPVVPRLPGIDVSHFQQSIDWPAVAGSGVRFCFIKVTEGTRCVDPRFTCNWQGAAAAGLLRGAYHFFHPAVPAAAQADFFIRQVDRLGAGDLPPALDLEVPGDWANIPPENRAPLALKWLEIVESRWGVTPIVYLSPAFATEILRNAPAFARFPVWFAHHTTAPAPDIAKPWNSWTFWQYTDKGTTPGVPRLVDLDWFNGSLDVLKSLSQKSA